MAYQTYAENVTTTPETIWSSAEGPSPRAIKMSCTTQNCKIRLIGAYPGASADPIILTAGADPFEFIITSRMTNGISKIEAEAVQNTSVLTLETTAV